MGEAALVSFPYQTAALMLGYTVDIRRGRVYVRYTFIKFESGILTKSVLWVEVQTSTATI